MAVSDILRVGIYEKKEQLGILSKQNDTVI
jgi:hypothetical protein